MRCRIDFKYALGLELDDPGFHHSVLTDFCDRLLRDGRADRLLDLALARLKEAGLVRERTAQRTARQSQASRDAARAVTGRPGTGGPVRWRPGASTGRAAAVR
ncbi:transposase [Actinoallomurus acaciae]|uniref:Transposase n=1 Tax=Actinoallomurus acaciae TaxID=502577 RepID=A0ABV5YXX5_9ACTN